MPRVDMPLLHDLGPILGAWVSAFEALVHPGGETNVSFKIVADAIDAIPWSERKLQYRRCRVKWRSNRPLQITIASKIYKRIYDARNKFLHGNPIGQHDLQVRAQVGHGARKITDTRFLLNYAPLILRALLLENLQNRLPPPDETSNENIDVDKMSALIIAHMDEREFEEPLRRIVDAN